MCFKIKLWGKSQISVVTDGKKIFEREKNDFFLGFWRVGGSDIILETSSLGIYIFISFINPN